jgi:hypothetical protein
MINKEQCKSKKIKLKEEQLDLQCEWRDCDYRTRNLDHFVCYVSPHLPHLEVKVNEDQKEEQLDLQCEWQDCDYHTCNLDHFVCYVSLHLPHIELKVNEDQEGTGYVCSIICYLISASVHF